jgi:hypothetical protein
MRQWAHVVLRLATHPEEACFQRKSDGLTALHLAVISRASFSKCETVSSDCDRQAVRNVWFDCDENPSPLDVIRHLVKACPSSTRLRCKKMGYTPLAYACLVPPRPSPDEGGKPTADSSTSSQRGTGSLESAHELFWSCHSKIFDEIILGEGHVPPEDMFEEAETLVRVLLEGDRECLSIQSDSELNSVDIHVISFSQARGADESIQTGRVGKTTTSVLRVLLEYDPSLARSRFMSSSISSEVTVAGPLEYLYRWNAIAILEAVKRQDVRRPSRRVSCVEKSNESQPTRAVLSSSTPASSTVRASSVSALSISTRSTVPSDIGSWWIWQWAMILLKYSILHIKKRGAPFSALHAAAYMDGCPLSFLLLIMRVFPSQVMKRDEMVLNSAILPLQIVCTWSRNHNLGAIAVSRKGMAISALVSEYPGSAKMVDDQGRYALFCALESKTTFDAGIQKLIETYPEVLRVKDPTTQLYPFLLAATISTDDSAPRLWTIYELLRADPRVLQDCFETGSFDSEDNGGWAIFGAWDPL